MTMINLKDMPFSDLLQLWTQVVARIAEVETEEKEKARRQIRELAKAHELSLEDVLGKPVNAKYANPQNTSQTWTGRGRKPLWVQNLLDAGQPLESLRIQR